MKRIGTVRIFFYAFTLLFLSRGYGLQIGDIAPDFTANTSKGIINFHDWGKDKYVLLFSHPLDFTPVCTTELAAVHNLKNQLSEMNTLVIGLSVDSVERHQKWIGDILSFAKSDEPIFPLIDDGQMEVAKLYGMLGQEAQPSADRTAVDNMTVRSAFLVGKDKKIKLMIAYPMTTGRNFDEIIRVLKSVQLTDNHNVATPANWKPGDDVVVPPSMTASEVEKSFGGLKTVKLPSKEHGHIDYLRYVKAPNVN